MIRVGRTGRYYCDGRECGYGVIAAPTGEFKGEWLLSCLDCGDAMYEGRPIWLDCSDDPYSPRALARLAASAYQAPC